MRLSQRVRMKTLNILIYVCFSLISPRFSGPRTIQAKAFPLVGDLAFQLRNVCHLIVHEVLQDHGAPFHAVQRGICRREPNCNGPEGQSAWQMVLALPYLWSLDFEGNLLAAFIPSERETS